MHKSSGKRAGKAKAKKGNRYLASLLGETAAAAGKTQTREGARYRRIARRRGKAKACIAVGNTQLKVYHKLLSSPGMRYEDLGPDYYERQASTRRQIAHHVGKLGGLGFEVTLSRIPQSRPRRPSAHHSRLTRTHPNPAPLRSAGCCRARLRSIFRVSNHSLKQGSERDARRARQTLSSTPQRWLRLPPGDRLRASRASPSRPGASLASPPERRE